MLVLIRHQYRVLSIPRSGQAAEASNADDLRLRFGCFFLSYQCHFSAVFNETKAREPIVHDPLRQSQHPGISKIDALVGKGLLKRHQLVLILGPDRTNGGRGAATKLPSSYVLERRWLNVHGG